MKIYSFEIVKDDKYYERKFLNDSVNRRPFTLDKEENEAMGYRFSGEWYRKMSGNENFDPDAEDPLWIKILGAAIAIGILIGMVAFGFALIRELNSIKLN